MTIYEHLGDVEAKNLVTSQLRSLAREVTKRGGRVIKFTGDGLLSSFDDEEAALWAAAGMSSRMAAEEIDIRIGVVSGPVLEEGNDVYGDVVNTAARVAALAKPTEILISRSLKGHLPMFMATFARDMRPVRVKGKSESLDLVAIQFPVTTDSMMEATWSLSADQTSACHGSRSETEERLELHYDGTVTYIEPGTSFTVGRAPSCDLVVSHPAVSRLHAEVTYNQGRFELHDHSTNGTYLGQLSSSRHLVRRKAKFSGAGTISLGAAPTGSGGVAIQFHVRPRVDLVAPCNN
jgi:adenylate cyclase